MRFLLLSLVFLVSCSTIQETKDAIHSVSKVSIQLPAIVTNVNVLTTKSIHRLDQLEEVLINANHLIVNTSGRVDQLEGVLCRADNAFLVTTERINQLGPILTNANHLIGSTASRVDQLEQTMNTINGAIEEVRELIKDSKKTIVAYRVPKALWTALTFLVLALGGLVLIAIRNRQKARLLNVVMKSIDRLNLDESTKERLEKAQGQFGEKYLNGIKKELVRIRKK